MYVTFKTSFAKNDVFTTVVVDVVADPAAVREKLRELLEGKI